MPTTIEEPIVGGPFAPGFWVRASTDLIGPLQPGSTWSVEILAAPPLENSFGAQTFATSDHSLAAIFGLNSQSQTILAIPGQKGFADGQQAQIRVQLRDPTNLVLEQAQQDITIDTRTPTGWQIQTQGQAQGGLTEQEHTWLDDTQQAVARTFQTAQGLLQATPIGSLISHPPLELLNFFSGSFTLSGRGRLDAPAPLHFAGTYGLVYQLTTVPPGFGKRDGSVIEWQQRIVQFALLVADRDLTAEYVLEVQELHLDTFMWVWNQFNPRGILYDVTPGCVLTCRWLAAS